MTESRVSNARVPVTLTPDAAQEWSRQLQLLRAVA